MVTAASLASMGVSALSTFVLPIIILVVARRRWGCSLWSAAVGALVFVVFALLLEGGLHALVFAAIPNLPSKPMLYTIYAVLAAGVFEELGRVCGFAVLQASDRRPDGVGRALGAGIGHGGIEAMLLVGVGMVSSLVTSVSIINAGASEAFLAGLPDAQRDIVARQFELLINTPAPFYLLSIGERTIAIALHIALSVLVWMAFTGRIRRWWILGAILAHALADAGAALYQSGAVSVFVAQGWALIVTIILALAVKRIYVSAKAPRGRAGLVSERRAGHDLTRECRARGRR